MALQGTCFLFSGTPESIFTGTRVEDIAKNPRKEPITLRLFAKPDEE